MKRSILLLIAIIVCMAAAAYGQDFKSLMAEGDALFEKGDYRGASFYYEQGLMIVQAKAPDENLLIALVRMQLGRCYVSMNNDNTALINYHDALYQAKRGIVKNPVEAKRIIFGAYGSILDIYDRLGMTEPMLSVTDEFIAFIRDYQKDPLPEDKIPKAEVDNFLAYCLAQKGEKLDEALTLAESALKAEPKSAAFLDTKGWVLLKMGKVEEARDVLKEALDLCTKENGNSCYIIQKHLKVAVGGKR